jgi:hypothetical protein
LGHHLQHLHTKIETQLGRRFLLQIAGLQSDTRKNIMTKFYSQTTNGFYTSDIHSAMPSDVVEITEQQWLALLDGQANGQQIQADQSGNPILVTPEPVKPIVLTPAEKLANAGLSVSELKSLLGL